MRPTVRRLSRGPGTSLQCHTLASFRPYAALASRLILEITDVRVQPLQDISEQDAAGEGLASDGAEAARISFSRIWE